MKSIEIMRRGWRRIEQVIKPRKNSLNLYPNSARKTGVLIIGAPGTGKTRHLEAWIMDDILAGRGVAVFDVHGSLFYNILYRLAALYDRFPKLAERLVVIDPTTTSDYIVTFNPLAAIEGLPLERVSAFMSDVVIKIWNINTTQSPRMAHLMAQSFQALADLGFTLLDLPDFLQHKEWRSSLLPQLTRKKVRKYFTHQFPTSPKEIHSWITPLLNKVEPILDDPEIAMTFARNSKITYRQMMDQQKILLVHLPKGIIGEGAASLMGALNMAMIQKAALGRDINPYMRQFYLYLDEFQNYTTTHISDALAESRKFGLTLIMAHQFGAQISNEELKNAVVNTTGTIISFRIGYKDARALVPNIFPYPGFLAEDGSSSWEDCALELANLPNRVYWLRRRGPYEPVRKYTREMPDPILTPRIKANLAKMLDISGRRYGVKKSELQQRLAENETDVSPTLSASQKRRRRRKKNKQMQSGDQSANLIEDGSQTAGEADDLPETDRGGDVDEFPVLKRGENALNERPSTRNRFLQTATCLY